jgi:hypothetical protein
MGFALATASAAAIGALSAERAGVGSAVMQAGPEGGSPIRAAILGSVLKRHLPRPAQPRRPADLVAGVVRNSVFTGVAAAQRLGSAALLHAVRCLVHGMDVMLWACATIAVAGWCSRWPSCLLPGRTATGARLPAEPAALDDDAVVRG